MKQSMHILFTMVVASICSMAFANSGYVYTQELNSVYASRAIYVCSDNSVVVLGNSDDTQEIHWYMLAITKLDAQGNLLWRQYLDGGGILISITGVDIDAADTVTFITTTDTIILWTIDSAGTINLISEYPYLPNQGICFNKALRTPDNEIVAVGKASQNYDVSSACFFRFSSAGDTLATAFWPVDQGSLYLEAEAYDLAFMDNGNVLVTCTLHTSIRTILEINQDGSIASRTNLPGEDHLNVVPICRESNNTSYIIAYRKYVYPNYSIFVDRFENGVFESLFTISDSRLSDVNSMILGTDCIYICGLSGINASLLSLNQSGALNWSMDQQGSNTCVYMVFGSYSTALLALDDDGCVYWAWGNGGQQVITKLLPNGQLPIEDEMVSPPVNRISAYPNPMKDHLNIKITQDDGAVTGENRIEIYNIKGQLVRSIEVSKGETEWDGKDKQGKHCPLGIYLLRFDKSLTTKICKSY